MLYTHLSLLLYTHLGRKAERALYTHMLPYGCRENEAAESHQDGAGRLKRQGVAQPAARLVRDEEVAGAEPATLTRGKMKAER
jgi:hypothetical protein